METCKIVYCGVKVEVPLVGNKPLHIPYAEFEDFESYCGPGKWGDKFVPDVLFGVPMHLACFIHDRMYEHGAPTWDDFYQSNWVFHRNMLRTADYFKPPFKPDEYRHARYSRINLYYQAVDTDWGRTMFMDRKRGQGHLRVV